MSSIRKFVYAGLLAVTALSFAPNVASAQEAHGKFTLTHDVRWQSAIVPAGEYRFSFDPDGVSGVLTLSKVSGSRTGFLIAVRDTDETKGSGPGRLLLQTGPEGSYVSAMQLPDFGVTLRFRMPIQISERQVAKAGTAAPIGQ